MGESQIGHSAHTREINRSQLNRQNTVHNSRTASFHTVNNDTIHGHQTRTIPTARGISNATTHNTANFPRQNNTARDQMSRTQRINGVNSQVSGNTAPYAYVTQQQRKKRKLPFKVRLMRFVRKYSTLVEVALACLLFFAISIPLVVFALGDPTDNDSAVYELSRETDEKNDVLDIGKEPDKNQGDKPTLNAGLIGTTNVNTTDEPTETPEETAPETPVEESTDTEEATTEEESTGEVETEDPNAGKFPVTIYFYDREAITCYTKPATLRQILANEGCTLKDSDRPTVDLDTEIKYESWIMIDSVSYKQVTESEAIPFSTETYETDTVPRGTVKTVSWGVNGSKEKVYTVEYVNGKEVNRTFQYDYIASYPSNQIDYYGVGGTFTASDGTVYSYSYRVDVRATYYNIYGTTAIGLPTGHNIVAVDPNVFPLGTEMYVISDTYDMGYRIAADTGGAVKGNLIDIWMDETNPYYYQFAHQGVCNMTAYVLG